MLADNPDSSWCALLPHIALAINSVPSVSTGVSPHMLVFGQDLATAVDWAIASPSDTDNDAKSFTCHVQRIVTAAQRAMVTA